MVYLNKNVTLSIALPDDSDNCELVIACEAEWLFEEVSSLNSQKRFYLEASRATRLSESPFYTQVFWFSSNKIINSNRYGQYKNTPLISMLMRNQGFDITYSKVLTEHIMVNH